MVLAARRPDRLDAQLRRSARTGGRAIAVPPTWPTSDEVALLVERAPDSYGRVDVLVNNAGAGWYRPLASSPPGEIGGLARVNLLGAMCLTRGLLPGMLDRTTGRS